MIRQAALTIRAMSITMSLVISWPSAAEDAKAVGFLDSCLVVSGHDVGYQDSARCKKPALESPKEHARYVTSVIKAIGENPRLDAQASGRTKQPKEPVSSFGALKSLEEKIRIQNPPSSGGYAGQIIR